MTRNTVLDVAERVFWTAVVAFLGPLVASPIFDNLGLGWQDALKVSAAATVGTLAKALLAVGVNRTNGAQLGVDSVRVLPDENPR